MNANSDVDGTLSSTGNLTVTSNTDSTGPSGTVNFATAVASIKTSGGVSIAKKLFVGETINSTGAATVGGDLLINGDTAGASSDGGAGALKVPNGGAYIGGTLHLGGAVEATSYVEGSELRGELQYSLTVAGSAFKNTGNVAVTLPSKTAITVADAASNNGVRADMTATPSSTADTLVLRNATGGAAFGSGGLTSVGDIIAFLSDIRLKTNIEPIQNALDKVLSLNGFTYNFNEIGEGLGFDTTLRHAGVSAQEIQAVLPEAVCPSPASDEYLTVKYEKLVPLLIEAIKELKAEINELKGVK